MTDPVSGVGLENIQRQSHVYINIGSYVVSVTASNDAGSVVASLVVKVESKNQRKLSCLRSIL